MAVVAGDRIARSFQLPEFVIVMTQASDRLPGVESLARNESVGIRQETEPKRSLQW